MSLSLVMGDGQPPHTLRRRVIARAIRCAIEAGYTIGQKVHIGVVPGVIIGYNIGDFGPYPMGVAPLLVQTPFGPDKCPLREVALD